MMAISGLSLGILSAKLFNPFASCVSDSQSSDLSSSNAIANGSVARLTSQRFTASTMLLETEAGSSEGGSAGRVTGTFFNGNISRSAQIVEPERVIVWVLAPSTVARTVSAGGTIVYVFNTACFRNDSANTGPTSSCRVASLT